VPVVPRRIRGVLQLDIEDPSGYPLADVPNECRPVQQPSQPGIERIPLAKQRSKFGEFNIVTLVHMVTLA